MMNKYHPFNGLKTLVHVEYWKPIVENRIVPPPRNVSIDPCSICDSPPPPIQAVLVFHCFNIETIFSIVC